MPALVSLYLLTPSFPSSSQFQKHQHLEANELNSSLTSASAILAPLQHTSGASSTGLFCNGPGTETKPEPGVPVNTAVCQKCCSGTARLQISQLTLHFSTKFSPAWQQQLCYFQPKFDSFHPCTRIRGWTMNPMKELIGVRIYLTVPFICWMTWHLNTPAISSRDLHCSSTTVIETDNCGFIKRYCIG